MLDEREPGLLVAGGMRLGKSKARRYLEISVAERIPDLTILSHRCHRQLRPNKDDFLTGLLDCSGDPDPTVGRTVRKRIRLLQRLLDRADRSGRGQVVLFLDNAHKLQAHEYEWLIELYDDLEEQGAMLALCFFGQPELIHQRQAFQMAGKRHIIGRFMAHDFAFHGIISVDELEYCLRGYDSTEYPKGSGWTYTRYFFPDAFDAGWRLPNLSTLIWDTFLEITVKHALSRYEEIPMLHFAHTINALCRQGLSYGIEARICKSQLEEIITNTGFLKFRQFSVDAAQSHAG